jgi:hypothetical protein
MQVDKVVIRDAAVWRRLQELKREMQGHSVPSKRMAKRAASQNPFARKDKQLLATMPGSSRSAGLDVLKAVNAERTGCIVTDKVITAAQSARNANTTQGNYVRTITTA